MNTWLIALVAGFAGGFGGYVAAFGLFFAARLFLQRRTRQNVEDLQDWFDELHEEVEDAS